MHAFHNFDVSDDFAVFNFQLYVARFIIRRGQVSAEGWGSMVFAELVAGTPGAPCPSPSDTLSWSPLSWSERAREFIYNYWTEWFG